MGDPKKQKSLRTLPSFTASERRALIVLGAIFVIGLIGFWVKDFLTNKTTPPELTLSYREQVDIDRSSSQNSEVTDSMLISTVEASGVLRIEVNRATKEELQKLPGIGPVLATRILEFRESYGNFQVEKDLLLVNGIGEGKLKKIRPYIIVNP
ncbi:helix-hairpin-helix domain-containing protein [bacterium]|nr:helix-hairpin-helix domain-containing protein [bacterium]